MNDQITKLYMYTIFYNFKELRVFRSELQKEHHIIFRVSHQFCFLVKPKNLPKKSNPLSRQIFYVKSSHLGFFLNIIISLTLSFVHGVITLLILGDLLGGYELKRNAGRLGKGMKKKGSSLPLYYRLS